MKRVYVMLALVVFFLCVGCEKAKTQENSLTNHIAVADAQNTEAAQDANQPWAVDYSALPERTKIYMPMLEKELKTYWPDMDEPSVLCGLIEQETCYSLKHKYCWSPTATLKNSREEGRGLGQITRAWDSKGNLRFDALKEVRERHLDALAGWSWKNVSDATFQIRGLIFEFRDNYVTFTYAKTKTDQLAFADSAYNGGRGGVLQDRALCKSKPGCDPNVWMGHVSEYSRKSRKSTAYQQSFYAINRNHVKQVVYGQKQGYNDTRRSRYQRAGLK